MRQMIKAGFAALFMMFLAFSLTACAPPKDPVSKDQVIQNQDQGKAVSLANARHWLGTNIIPDGAVLNPRVDTFISITCSQGDGYGSVDVMIPIVNDKGAITGQRIYASLECPTYGQGGCINKDDIKKGNVKTFKKDTCDTSLPAIFPKLTG